MGDAEGLKSLNSLLRSLAVSTPTSLDAATLLRDYRLMMGQPLPCQRYGYRDPVLFLRERCSESFLFQGPRANPTLTLIVNDSIKHIDQYVQRQKVSSKTIKGRRRSVPVSVIRTPQSNLVASSYNSTHTEPSKSSYSTSANNAPRRTSAYYDPPKPARPASPTPVIRPEPPKVVRPKTPEPKKPEPVDAESAEESSDRISGLTNGHAEGGEYTRQRLQRFMEKRNSAYSSQQLNGSAESLRHTDADSGRLTSSSLGARSSSALDALKDELVRLVAQHPDGVWCSQLLRLYEEEYGRELNFSRFGFPSVSACASAVQQLCCTRAPGGDWLLAARGAAPSPVRLLAARGAAPSPVRLLAAPSPVLRLRRAAPERPSPRARDDSDDALPGIEYDPDVYPADCLSFMESIPAGSVCGVAPGDMLAVEVGELYSPSHLWVLRLGQEYDTMDGIMDEMTEYYTKGEGRDRVLAAGARRPGQYCSSVFDGDWHRSLIVQQLNADTVKVLHVDYGTVDTVAAGSLRPLLRRWAALPAMAVRARLAGLRPAAASRRWPRAAAAHCLQLVRDRQFVANVVAVDHEENILELFLIDTSTAEDVNITDELIRAGHADPRPRPALGVSDLGPGPAPDPDDTSDRSDRSEPAPRLDVRELLSRVLLGPREPADDDVSDVSVSASEVVGREPRRLPAWEPDHESDRPEYRSIVDRESQTGSNSSRLDRLRARPTRVEPVVPSSEPPSAAVVNVPTRRGEKSLETEVTADEPESVVSIDASSRLAKLRAKAAKSKDDASVSSVVSPPESVASAAAMARLKKLCAKISQPSDDASMVSASVVSPPSSDTSQVSVVSTAARLNKLRARASRNDDNASIVTASVVSVPCTDDDSPESVVSVASVRLAKLRAQAARQTAPST